LSKLIC
jgi:serine/threonine kinase 16